MIDTAKLRITTEALDDVGTLKSLLRMSTDEIDALRVENKKLGEVYRSACPQCGYVDCVRGRKACDTELRIAVGALEFIAVPGALRTREDWQMKRAREALAEINAVGQTKGEV